MEIIANMGYQKSIKIYLLKNITFEQQILSDIEAIDVDLLSRFGMYKKNNDYLDYDEDIDRWIRDFKTNYYKSIDYAREYNFKFIKNYINNAINHIGDKEWVKSNIKGSFNADLLRFLSFMNANDIDLSIRTISHIKPIGKMFPNKATMPDKKPFSFLEEKQKKILSESFHERNDLSKLQVAVYSSDGISLDLNVFSSQYPNKPPKSKSILGISYSSNRLDDIKKKHFFLLMSKLKTPEKAMLGAKFNENGVDKFLLGKDIEIVVPENKKMSRIDFLGLVNAQTGLHIFSDCFTSDIRISLTGGKKSIRLSEAAEKFESVFYVNENTLHCRSIFWPLLLSLELPYPIAENLIRKKSENKYMKFKDLISLYNYKRVSVENLYGYNDGKVEFRTEIECIFGMPNIVMSELFSGILRALARCNYEREIDFRKNINLSMCSEIRKYGDLIAQSLNIETKLETMQIFQEDDDHGCILRLIDQRGVIVFQQNIPANL